MSRFYYCRKSSWLHLTFFHFCLLQFIINVRKMCFFVPFFGWVKKTNMISWKFSKKRSKKLFSFSMRIVINWNMEIFRFSLFDSICNKYWRERMFGIQHLVFFCANIATFQFFFCATTSLWIHITKNTSFYRLMPQVKTYFQTNCSIQFAIITIIVHFNLFQFTFRTILSIFLCAMRFCLFFEDGHFLDQQHIYKSSDDIMEKLQSYILEYNHIFNVFDYILFITYYYVFRT